MPMRIRRIMALISAAAIVIGMIYVYLPTWDYIEWMKIRKTSTVKNPFTGAKIPMRDVFSVYAIFMIAVGARYAWLMVDVFRNGPPKTELEVTLEDMAKEDKDDGEPS
jgi:C4-dicarboxylate transporter DctQ subunit